MKNLNFDWDTIAALYRAFGRDTVKRLITMPRATIMKIAARNKDEAEELIDKRDRWVTATLDFAEEIANADDD